MQKLAMMMAVMILGMSPAHGYSIGADSRSPEVGGQVEMVPLLFRGYSDDWTLIARNTVSSIAAEGNQPAEPGGYPVGGILQQIQSKIEDLEGMRNRILRLEQDEAEESPGEQGEGPEPRDGNHVYKLEGEAAPKVTETLRKGADAARGRGRMKGRLYQRTGARN